MQETALSALTMIAAAGKAGTDAPAADRVIAGAPRFSTWNATDEEDGKLFTGVWEATPGKWRIEYDEWEFCHIISGISILTDGKGASRRLGAGDAFVIHRGFRGTWEVVETTRKHYVIRL